MFNEDQDAFVGLGNIFSEKTRPVVFWIGAGLSAPAGLPTWNELKDILIRKAQSELNLCVSGDDNVRMDEKRARLNLAIKGTEPWESMDLLYRVLGEQEYYAKISQVFTQGLKSSIPGNYFKILSLSSAGIITTNIDRLVSSALHQDSKNDRGVCTEFSGRTCRSHMHVLGGERFFVLNIHGVFENRGELVLRKTELDSLLMDGDYKKFLAACFLTKSIIFVGASIEDRAICAHLELVRGGNAENHIPHYWITSDQSERARLFCEKYNIRQIFYSSSNGHEELGKVLDALKKYRSYEAPIERPVSSISTTAASVRNFDAQDLESLPLNELRGRLNKKAKEIVTAVDDGMYERYKDFRKKYARYIHMAWFVDASAEKEVLSYTIEKEEADGAFGRVFRAKDAKGDIVALKLLKEDVMRKEDCLQSFRRGVRAMQILEARKIDGIVRYLDASEIPAFVAMEFIDGINLKEAIDNNQLKEWRDILRVLCDVAKIIRNAHGLPERVLHRDIRPQNIMLKGYDYSSEDWSVCVLDFDLAFHKNANEVSIQMAGGVNGFLAPEQTEADSSMTTRSALVDSYGVGMLMYYIVSRKMPAPGLSLQISWKDILRDQIRNKRCVFWQSIPHKMAYIINRCTLKEQSQRMDMSQIAGGLEALYRVACNNDTRLIDDIGFLLEEFVVRVAYKLDLRDCIEWDVTKIKGCVKRYNGEQVRFEVDDETVSVFVEWQNDGRVKYEEVKNKLTDTVNAIKQKLLRQGIKDVSTSHNYSGAMVGLSFSKVDLQTSMDKFVDILAAISLAPKTY